MPEKRTLARARADKRAGKSPSTQAGEFVREEIDHIRAGKHGARSAKQAIAIGLSKARRAGVELPAPARGKTSSETRGRALRDLVRAHSATRRRKTSAKRSRVSVNTLRREPRNSVSTRALSRHAHAVARRRSAKDRSASARAASKTKGPAKRREAAQKGARTRRKAA